MANVLVALTILLILGLAIFRIIIEKRKGMKCVGCHLSGGCASNKRTTHNVVIPKMNNRIAIKELT